MSLYPNLSASVYLCTGMFFNSFCCNTIDRCKNKTDFVEEEEEEEEETKRKPEIKRSSCWKIRAGLGSFIAYFRGVGNGQGCERSVSRKYKILDTCVQWACLRLVKAVIYTDLVHALFKSLLRLRCIMLDHILNLSMLIIFLAIETSPKRNSQSIINQTSRRSIHPQFQ